MKSTVNLRLHELPAELAELDDLVTDYEAWETLPQTEDLDTLLGDSAEREALGRAIERRFAVFEGVLQERGEQLHHWLCRLRSESEAADAELDRVRKLAKVRKRKLERVKDYVRTTLEAMGLTRLQGAAWRLRVQTNGGRQTVEHDGRTWVPAELAAPVELDPALLIARVRAQFLPGADDALILRALGIEPASLEPSAERVHGWVKEHGGEVPAGFNLAVRGTHLRVE